jgi:repressor LexA
LRFVFSLPMRGGMVTRRQKQVLDFLQTYLRRHGYAPSLEEIGRHLGVASLATVHKHLTRLEGRGVIRRRAHQSRSVEVLDRPAGGGGVTVVPLLGRVAAGRPIDPVETAESVSLPEELLGKGETFALRVVGDSMIGDGILDGDVVVVESRPDAPNGATVVAVVGGEATVKRFYRRRGRVHLVPANERIEPIVASPDDVQVRGVVIGLLRRYR